MSQRTVAENDAAATEMSWCKSTELGIAAISPARMT
jgi:hypothetical protein